LIKLLLQTKPEDSKLNVRRLQDGSGKPGGDLRFAFVPDL
jgi:hypothetical protein